MKIAFSLVWLWKLFSVLEGQTSWPYVSYGCTIEQVPRLCMLETRDCRRAKEKLEMYLAAYDRTEHSGRAWCNQIDFVAWGVLVECFYPSQHQRELESFDVFLRYGCPTVIAIVLGAWLHFRTKYVASSQVGGTTKPTAAPGNLGSQVDSPSPPENQSSNTGPVKRDDHDEDEDWDKLDVSKKRPPLKNEETET
jgi:hypothetical protein